MLSADQAQIRAFTVVPSLPKPLQPLLEIGYNLWWTWQPAAVDLFMRVDRELWSKTGHNPIKLLGAAPQKRLQELTKDKRFMSCLKSTHDRLKDHLERESWHEREYGGDAGASIAYFCAEFGLSECLPIYSGGLGILAGDHLKSASELGIPLIGVGLLYRHGYFQQYLNADGWQQEFYPDLDFTNLPTKPVLDDNGEQVKVDVDVADRKVNIAVWRTDVGRVRLYLLDTNLPENSGGDREITSQLYGGDMDMRIRQEIVLGVGGVRALEAVGEKPSVFHLNEGHAAFLSLERIRRLIEDHDVSFDEARWAAAGGNVFTTHTPVPAGIDRFPPDMVKRYFERFVPSLRLDMEGLFALGRENVFNKDEFFSMAVLALRTSDAANGVSKLHGEVSRSMWEGVWPGVPNEEVPIAHVTNGVHARSWLSPEMTDLFDKHLPASWLHNPEDQSVWDAIEQIPDEDVWDIRQERRRRLVNWVRKRLHRQLERRGAGSREIAAAAEALDPETLTIGFARRFATYKRANLLFHDPDRIRAILNNNDRPVQIVLAGKAHPADTQGKELIRQIIHYAREGGGEFRRIVFLENYDIHVARYLVSGVDVWLNTPRRGMEASGTSGMKAALNGVLNLSILDGWWDEAWEQDLGWAIGSGEIYGDYDYQDRVESEALYDLLEKQVVPAFYERQDGMPKQWLGYVKHCLQKLSPMFNTNRMVRQYADQFYMPANERSHRMLGDNLARARGVNDYKRRVRENWDAIKVESIDADVTEPLGISEPLKLRAEVQLGDLSPDDVRVQVYVGPMDVHGNIVEGETGDLACQEDLGGGRFRYAGEMTLRNSGQHGFAVRVVPGHEDMPTPFEPGLIVWDREHAPKRSDKEPVVAASA